MTTRLICAAAAALLPVLVAHAADPPQVREGLWEIHSKSTENPGSKTTEIIYRLCRDHAYDKAALEMAKSIKGCTSAIKSLGGAKFSADSQCTIEGTQIKSIGTASYQGDTAMHSETRTTYTPGFNGKTDEVMVQDQKFVGACPAGMQPGDQMTPEGKILHRGQ